MWGCGNDEGKRMDPDLQAQIDAVAALGSDALKNELSILLPRLFAAEQCAQIGLNDDVRMMTLRNLWVQAVDVHKSQSSLGI